MTSCPECDKEINEATEICPHCGADLTIWTAAQREERKMPLGSLLARWIPFLIVLIGAIGFFIWYMMKHRVP